MLATVERNTAGESNISNGTVTLVTVLRTCTVPLYGGR